MGVRVAAVLGVVAVLFVGVPPVSARIPVVEYRPPVDVEVVDPFRPPTHPYGPGNRGVDYATMPGTPVRAAAPGIVVFAGPVAGSRHVTVLHADGIRTSYSFLATVAVRRGDRVDAGQALGRSGAFLHLGARVGDEYVDPGILFDGVAGRRLARLVPDDDRGPASEAQEYRLLGELVRSLPPAVLAGVRAGEDLAERAAGAVRARLVPLAEQHEVLRLWLAHAQGLSPPAWRDVAAALAAWSSRTRNCTSGDRPSPPTTGRRIVVLVAGLGSSSRSAAVDDVDTVALGYRPLDVHRFSYRGGTVAERGYAPKDTTGDLWTAGARLRVLLRRLARAAPGVPIDVVAHSQGGLVARAALARGAPSQVVTLVTLGTPHQGADLAAAPLLRALGAAGLTGVRPDSPALRQLAPGSVFLRELARRPLPPGVRATSVAARGDVIVASPRTRLPGAGHAVVSAPGFHDHARLPGSPAATREIALALSGLPPTCRSLADAAADAVAGEVIAAGQRLLAAARPPAAPG